LKRRATNRRCCQLEWINHQWLKRRALGHLIPPAPAHFKEQIVAVDHLPCMRINTD
jgi:hypothetical protein